MLSLDYFFPLFSLSFFSENIFYLDALSDFSLSAIFLLHQFPFSSLGYVILLGPCSVVHYLRHPRVTVISPSFTGDLTLIGPLLTRCLTDGPSVLHDLFKGANPSQPIRGCSSVVEHLLAKERVESSNLFIRFLY